MKTFEKREFRCFLHSKRNACSRIRKEKRKRSEAHPESVFGFIRGQAKQREGEHVGLLVASDYLESFEWLFLNCTVLWPCRNIQFQDK